MQDELEYVAVVGVHSATAVTPWVKERTIALVDELYDKNPYLVFVSGGAPGVDSIAEARAWWNIRDLREIAVMAYDPIIFYPEVFPPGHPRAGSWTHNGAGIVRNGEIVKKATALHAIWDGCGPGTRNSIERAMKKGILEQVIFTNGIEWNIGDRWNPLEYGATMADQLNLVRLSEVLVERLLLNRKNQKNRRADGSINWERVKYADGRTLHAFNRIAEGAQPEAGIGERSGLWIWQSENTKKKDVQPHHVGLDGWCDCSSVALGERWDAQHGRPCWAMYATWIHLRMINPEVVLTEREEMSGQKP